MKCRNFVMLKSPSHFPGKPGFGTPLAQHSDKDPVNPMVEDTNKRIAKLDGQPKRPAEQHDRENAVGPGIQSPLMGPNPHWVLAERSKVKDGPQVCLVRSARSDEIAKQVQVKNPKGQPKYMPAPPAKSGQNRRTKQGRGQAVHQPVMVLRIIKKISTGKGPVGNVKYYSQPIEIRHNPRHRHQSAIPQIIRSLRCHDPTGQQVGDRRHFRASALDRSLLASVALSDRKVIQIQGGKTSSLPHFLTMTKTNAVL